MRYRLSLILVPLFLLATVQALPGQATGDKKSDPKKEKESEKITEKTEINGKTLKEWIDLIPDKDRFKTEVAIKSIMLYGPELAKKAVPDLIKELDKHKPGVSAIDLSVRVNGCIALGMILGSVEEPSQKQVDDAVKVLTSMLKDDQVIVRFKAAAAVAQLGQRAQGAIPQLEKMVKDLATWENRHAAVMALGSVAWDKEKAVDLKVLDALYSRLVFSVATGAPIESCAKVRMSALQALAHLRAEQADKGNLKIKLDGVIGNDPDAFVKLRANMMVWSLLTTVAQKQTRAAAIAKYLDHKDPVARVETLQFISYLETKDREYFHKELNKALDKSEDAIIKLNIHVMILPLLKAPVEKKQKLTVIGNFLEDKEPGVRVEAAKALGHLGKEAIAEIPRLIKALGDKEPLVVFWSAWALGEMEQAANTALADLNKIAADKDRPEELRHMATEAVKTIQDGKKKEVPKKKEEPKKGGGK